MSTRLKRTGCALLAAAVVSILAPDVAFADDCSLQTNPSDCENTAWTIGTVATLAAAVAAIAVAASSARRLSEAERRDWEASATTAEPPDDCRPGAGHARKFDLGIAPGRLRVDSLTLVAGEESDPREEKLRGAPVDALDGAVISYRRTSDPGRLRPLAETVTALVSDEVAAWIGSLPEPARVDVGLHLVGGAARSRFVLYRCRRRGRRHVWVQEAAWDAPVQNERHHPLAAIPRLDTQATPDLRTEVRAVLLDPIRRFLEGSRSDEDAPEEDPA